MKTAERLNKIEPSKTLAISKRAKEMKDSGVDIIDFSLGEPDFSTPKMIVDSAKKSLDAGDTRYAPVPGILPLRKAIAQSLAKNRGTTYSPEQITVTCGAKSAIFIALQSILNCGDEVIVPAPYWVSYPDQVKLADGNPVIIQTKESNNFKFTADELERAITGKTRALIINSPSNPTGIIYTKDELSEIVSVCNKRNITIIADEIYDMLDYDKKFCSVLNADGASQDNIIYINGVSKGFAMTGWRMGYAAGPQNVISAINKYQGQLYTCIPMFVQKACITAYENEGTLTKEMFAAFKKRRDLVIKLINETKNLRAPRPDGAFYAFINNTNYMENSADFAEFLLNEAHVALVPGSAFGTEGFVRLSFATSEENIVKGFSRIKEALTKLK